MPINATELINLLAELSEEKGLYVTVKESAKGGLAAGLFTMAGGLLAGPAGLAVGGTVGGLTAAYMSSGKFQSVAHVLRNDLSPLQQQRLYRSVMRIVRSLDITDFVQLMLLVSTSENVKQLLIREVMNFLQSNLQMQVIN